jgi:formate-dependent nitrite reductase membrane component NrfD
MSWGAWILFLVFPVLVADAALVTHGLSGWLPSRVQSWLRAPRNVRAIAISNGALGAALGIYTGILLSSLGGRPFWASAALGPLFLASGLSSAAAFAHLTARRVEERELFARSDNAFLGAELLFITLLLLGLSSASRAHAEAAALVFGGPYTAVFWVGVVGIGMLLPLVTQSLAVSHRIHHTPIPPILVLAGGLLLRVVVVVAGQHSHFGIG